jgi:hypothetical protein
MTLRTRDVEEDLRALQPTVPGSKQRSSRTGTEETRGTVSQFSLMDMVKITASKIGTSQIELDSARPIQESGRIASRTSFCNTVTQERNTTSEKTIGSPKQKEKSK